MIVCAPSSATAPPETASAVLISGSYGGVYNAWHAVRKAAKAVILSDAGVGMNRAGISGLPWLGALGIPGATADYRTCHIGDGDHILQFGKISFVNSAAAALGCAAGEPVSDCARKLERASPRVVDVPAVEGGKRYDLLQREGRPPVIGLDAAPLLVEADAGSIAVTGSHAALFRGRPDNVINVSLRAAYFNDAGVGLDDAGIARLVDLELREMPAAAISCNSAEIGNARSGWATGIISHVNSTARASGIVAGMTVRESVAVLLGSEV
jgi:hypothetical protein